MTDRLELELEDEIEREALWLELRDRGRLYARYDPLAEVIEIRQRGETVRFELERYRFQVEVRG